MSVLLYFKTLTLCVIFRVEPGLSDHEMPYRTIPYPFQPVYIPLPHTQDLGLKLQPETGFAQISNFYSWAVLLYCAVCFGHINS